MIRQLSIFQKFWNKRLLNGFIILMVLALSFLIARQSPFERTLKLVKVITVLVAGGAGAVWLIRRYHWSPLLLITTALVVPYTISTGTEVSINAAMIGLGALFGLWAFDALVLKKRIQIPNSRSLYILIGLCAAAVVSFGVGQLDWFAFAPHAPIKAQLGGVGLYFLCAIAFMLPIVFIDEIIWLERATWFFLLLAFVYVAAISLPGFGRVGGLYNLGATGSVFWIWIVALSFSQGLINKKLQPGVRIALIGFTGATLANRFFLNQDWKSGWVPAIAALVVILFVARPKLGFPIAFGAGVIGLLAFRSFAANLNYFTYSGEDYSFLSRVEAWQILGQIIRANPITGLGPANYHFYTTIFPLRGYYVQFNSHNQYVDLVAQTGVIGLALFLWFAWEIGWLGWKLKSQAPEGFERAYAIGALGGLAGMLAAGMLGDWVIPFVYNIGFDGFQASMLGWLFLGGLAAMAILLKKSNRLEDHG